MALDALRSGFVSICIDPSLNYYDGVCKVLIEGQLPDPPDDPDVQYAAANEVVEVQGRGRQVAALFGHGVLAAAVNTAFCACPSAGPTASVKIYVLPRTPDSANVAAKYVMTFGGTATTAGRAQIFALNSGVLQKGEWLVDERVEIGDSAADIAEKVAAAYGWMDDFPYEVTADGDTVVLVAKDRGAIGNYLTPVYNYTNRPNVAPGGITFSVERTVTGTGAWTIDPTLGQDYATALGECCYDCYGLLTGESRLKNLLQAWIEAQWPCFAPQCFGHGYVWDEGTLGQVLAEASNAMVFNRIPYPVNDVNPPWMLVAEYATRSCCSACLNPELNIQGDTYGVLSCIERPATCVQPWNADDRAQLSALGFVNWGPAQMGSGATFTFPMIYEDITNYLYDEEGRPNVTWRSTSMTRWAKAFAGQVAQFLETTFDGLSFFDDGTAIRPGIQATTRALAYGEIVAWTRSQEGILISTIQDETTQIQLVSDFDVAVPCHGEPGKYWLRLIVGPPIRAARFMVRILPKLLDNCDRPPPALSQTTRFYGGFY